MGGIVVSRRKNNFRYKWVQRAKTRHGANRRSIIRRWSILPGMWEPSISYATPEIPANPKGNAARLKDINFLIESAKSCNDFSIGAISRPAKTRKRVFAGENISVSCILHTECLKNKGSFFCPQILQIGLRKEWQLSRCRGIIRKKGYH